MRRVKAVVIALIWLSSGLMAAAAYLSGPGGVVTAALIVAAALIATIYIALDRT